jgi:hypothetical protein
MRVREEEREREENSVRRRETERGKSERGKEEKRREGEIPEEREIKMPRAKEKLKESKLSSWVR